MQRNRNADGEYVYAQDMRQCTEKDFTDRGYTPDQGMIQKMEQRLFLCFDVEGPGNARFDLKNLYNAEQRNAF